MTFFTLHRVSNSNIVSSVPALFGALSIHTMVICRKDPIRRKLAENKSRQCMLALSEIAKSWPVGMWTIKLFVNLMRRLTEQGSAVSGGSIVNVTSRIYDNQHGNGSPAGPAGYSESGISDHGPAHFSSGADSNQAILGHQPGAAHLPDPQVSEFVPQTADQLVYDSFWAGWLDNTFEVDMILQNGFGPFFSGPSGGMHGEGGGPGAMGF